LGKHPANGENKHRPAVYGETGLPNSLKGGVD
jgi:hypothetical protein